MAIMPSLMMYSTTLQVSKSGDVYFSVGSTVASKMMPLTDIVAGPRDVFFPETNVFGTWCWRLCCSL